VPHPADRAERLLVLLVLQGLKGATQKERTATLSAAGLTNIEIADYLNLTPAAVASHLYEHRQTKPKKKTLKAKKPSRGSSG